MEGNYRQHYLLAASEAGNGLPQTASGCGDRQQKQQQQQQQQMVAASRLQPRARQDSSPGNYCPPPASNSRFLAESMESHRLARYFGQAAPEEQRGGQQSRMGRGEHCASGQPQFRPQTHHTHHQHQHQHQLKSSPSGPFGTCRPPDAASAQVQQQHYASQLRSSRTQAQSQLNHQQQPTQAMMMQQAAGSSQQQQQQQQDAKALHVNFNRANQAAGPEEGESRKKKYLTAKYGQQQMNLIKKRLKIEMWLCEQLQELAKGSKAELTKQAELDEIDIDLDSLLDMDDDHTRRRWLRKTLEPYDDLKPDRVDKFIGDVLEQSKLL